MSAMIARYLKDFGSPAFPAGEPAMSEDSSFEFGALSLPEPVIDIESERRVAYAEGHEKATEELTAQFAEEKAAIEHRHAEEIAALAERFENDIAALIAARLAAVTDDLSGSVTDTVAEVLVPFLGELAARKAVDELALQLKTAIEQGDAGRVKLRGPQSTFERLAGQMGDKAAMLEFEDSGELDLTAEIGNSVLVTRLSAFAANLEKVMK